ncbi:MAG: hypothetical protein AAGJ46_12110 [Planctomycetota bacterium]
MASEILAFYTTPQTAAWFVLTDGANAYDAVAGQWEALDPDDAGQRIAFDSTVAIGAGERRVGSLPAGVDASGSYTFMAFDDFGEIAGTGTYDGGGDTPTANVASYFARFGTSEAGRTVELLGGPHPSTVYASIVNGDGEYHNYADEDFATPGSGSLGDLALARPSLGDARPPSLDVASYAAFALPAGDYTVVWRDGQQASDTVLAVMPFYADGSTVWESRADAESSAVKATLATGGEARGLLEQAATSGGSGPPTDAQGVDPDLTWSILPDGDPCHAPQRITVNAGYSGPFLFDLADGISSVLIAGATVTLTPTEGGDLINGANVRYRVSDQKAVLFDVTSLAAGTYAVRLVVPTATVTSITFTATLTVKA